MYKIQNLEIQDMDNKIILLLMSYCVGCVGLTLTIYFGHYILFDTTNIITVKTTYTSNQGVVV